MRVLQINTTVNSGSHGRIAEEIGLSLIENGHESYIAAAYTDRPSRSRVIKIGNAFDRYWHGCITRFFDKHGFGSKVTTYRLVNHIRKIVPDIIHIHNIHGYYLHSGVLFNYLKSADKPIVWTFHDCWPFTGHCTYFERVNCYRWQSQCYQCPNKRGYPTSWFIDNSRENYQRKKKLFTGPDNIILVAPCRWMENHLRNSFLNKYDIRVIYNAVDLTVFKPANDTGIREKYNIKKKYMLGVASKWTARKGLEDFKELRKILPSEFEIVLVGLSTGQIKNLPSGITGVTRTENTESLSSLYSGAEIFVNPTYVDNFPSTNIEALACGTPVITYNTGGSPEAIDSDTGMVVEKGDVAALARAISHVLANGREQYTAHCRKRAEEFFDKNKNYKQYIDLYTSLL
ncbi:MAG: glycosyltransferase [Bacteroidales bacterium]